MNNLTDVRNFIRQCTEELGMGFHPDTPFDDYVNVDTGLPTYTPEQAEERQLQMEQAMEWCDENHQDIYEMSVVASDAPDFFDFCTKNL